MASFKGGFDYEFVSPPPKSLECSICLLTLRDPQVVSCCGHHFCQLCIGKVRAAKKPCPLCNEPDYDLMLHKGVKREVNSLAVFCPQKALGCDWSGEIGQVQCHLNIGSRDSGCSHLMMECIHQCGSKLPRKEITTHEDLECPNRPMESQFEQLAARLKLVMAEARKTSADLEGKINSLTAKNAELEMRCEAISSRNEDLEARNVSLESTLRDLKAKVDTIESEKQTLKNRVSMLESLALKVFHVERKQAQESRRLDQVGEAVGKETAELEARLTPSPPFYFTLCNFEHYQTVGFQWQSQPFHTSPQGYKLSIVVYPQGISGGKGTHVSLFVSILRGEYDDQLEWPFKGLVTVEVFNYALQSWDRKPEIQFEESDNVKFTGQPVNSHSNAGLGFPRWLSLEEVVQWYCHKGMIRFRVAKVEVFNRLHTDVDSLSVSL